ncbi:amidohydrolase family protein [Nonomuraea dietziae]|uniref:Imidazolonepropionase-like amidohydrolase n=1 Tax=Nonomuraea dietziae TaxID=65515 RepID=A0A7W5V9P8_9ACTN|nr:amidohydrolase family protein [Nonomuraea dietziae]MBB3727665.1 imidazolonepropionase-like amidohydrolase [Nonomuraea dietziae]
MRTLIRNVRVFDGVLTVPRTEVLIEDDRLAAYDGGRADLEIDGAGATLLPGLIDAHTHTFDGDLAQALRFGVTTELDMFCLPGNLARQRRLAAERDDVADLRSSGILATAPGGHPSQIMEATSGQDLGDAVGAFETVADAGQAKAFVEARLAEGADYLKIVIDSGHVAGLDLPVLAPDVVAALVEAGHAAGLMAIAHAVTTEDAVVALDAGVDGLAHLVTDPLPQELATRIAAQDVFVVSTLTYFEVVTGDPSGAELVRDERIGSLLPAQAMAALDRDPSVVPVHPDGVRNAVQAAAALHGAGVALLAGTDANPWAPLHGASMHREVLLLTEAGLSPAEALAAATSVPARRFGLADRGRIAPGFRADLLLVEGDPTTDITATRAIREIWRRGVRLAR